MWVVLVKYMKYKGAANVSQEAYKTYDEALAEMKSKNLVQINDYRFYDEEKETEYELKNIYLK